MKAQSGFHAASDARSASVRLPESIDEPGLLVGWSLELEHRKVPFGFAIGDSSPAATPSGILDPILLSGEGHLLTIAPTGTGKGRGCIIPALLRHEGPIIVIDPKGENVEVTARRRREMGHQVIVLDPVGLTDEADGGFNPLDLIDPESADSVDLAAMFASALIDPSHDPRNLYWYQRAQQLLIGLMLHAATHADPARRSFSAIREFLARLVSEQGDANALPDPDSAIAEVLSSPHPETRLAASILQNAAREGLGSILSMAQDGIDFFRGPLVQQATSATSFDPVAVTRGDPLSIYLVLPPHMMESHGSLLRLWIMALLSLITRRRGKPPQSTLLVLDEAAQLGTLPQLRQAITLLRGYGVQTWSFWQDVSQIRRLYPDDWETMVNNCRVVQCFGALNRLAADSMAGLTGFGDGATVLDLSEDEMLLQIAGDQAVVARRPDYLLDPAFKGQFDANPYHDPTQPVLPPPPARIQLFRRDKSGAQLPLASVLFDLDPASSTSANIVTDNEAEPADGPPFFVPRRRTGLEPDDLLRRLLAKFEA